MRPRLVALIVAIFSTLLALPSNSSAQGGENAAGFSFSPVPPKDPAVTERGYFIYKMTAGAGANGSVLLENTGRHPLTIEIAAVDAMTGQAGGSAFAPSGTKPVAVATWVELAEPSVTVGPGKQKVVGFSVRVPPSTKPGQYLAGIAAHAPDKPSKEAPKRAENQVGAAVNVRTRYVIAVQLDVPGAWAPSLTIPSVSVLEQPSGTHIGVRMRNDGGVFLKPSGSIVMSDSTGRRVLSHPIRMETFVTGTEVTYPVAWPGRPRPGEYSVDVRLSYARGKVAAYNGTLEIKPPVPPAESDAARQDASVTGPATEPGQRTSKLPSGARPWMLYGLGGLLLLVAILLALNLLRGRSRRKTVL